MALQLGLHDSAQVYEKALYSFNMICTISSYPWTFNAYIACQLMTISVVTNYAMYLAHIYNTDF